VFFIVCHFHNSISLSSKVESLSELQSMGRLLALPANIRLRLKGLTVTSTLTYYGNDFLWTVQRFMVLVAAHSTTLEKSCNCNLKCFCNWCERLFFHFHRLKVNFMGLSYKTFYGRNFRNKLECLSLVSLSSLVYCLWVRPWTYPRMDPLKVASLR